MILQLRLKKSVGGLEEGVSMTSYPDWMKKDKTGYYDSDVGDLSPRSDPSLYLNTLPVWAAIYLINMQQYGSGAPFGRHFFDTKFLRCSDPRDRAFGLLGISTFEGTPIMPDYSKTIAQVSAETTVAVMRDNFVSYVEYQPWLDDGTYPSWTIDLTQGSQDWIGYITTYDDDRDLNDALQAAHGIAPIVELSQDLSTLSTVGISLGQVVAMDDAKVKVVGRTDPRASEEQRMTTYLPQVRARLRSMGLELATTDMLSVLLEPIYNNSPDRDCLLLDLEALLRNDYDDTRMFEQFNLAVIPNDLERTVVFLTDDGHIGKCYRLDRPGLWIDSGQVTLFLAALFGIQLPFLLEDVGNGRFKLWGMANVKDHVLGDENIQAMGPDDD